MYIYNITCRTSAFVEGWIFKEVIVPEEVHNFIVRRERRIETDADLLAIELLAQTRFGGVRAINGRWVDYEWTPKVSVVSISAL